MAEEVFSLSRLVRTFGTERAEGERYLSYLRRLARISVRQAAAYLIYLTTASALYYVTKARPFPPPSHRGTAPTLLSVLLRILY